jgi:hypothetical protein
MPDLPSPRSIAGMRVGRCVLARTLRGGDLWPIRPLPQGAGLG